MKKITVLLLFVSVFNYGQINKNLIKNLDEISFKTDLATFFKGLPFDSGLAVFNFYDERFLRFYNIVVDEVEVGHYDDMIMMITPFNKKEDYEAIKSKLNELYGTSKLIKHTNILYNVWKFDDRDIILELYTDNGNFYKFNSITINFYQ